MTREDSIEMPPPVVPRADALAIARDYYGLAASHARALPGEYDANFEIDSGGRKFVLKVMHPARERHLVDLQCAALACLEQRAPGLALPRVHRTSRGELFTLVGDRLVWMLDFVDGTPLSDVRPRDEELLVGLGRFLGNMDRALAGFRHEADERDFKWDLSRAGWIEGSLHHVSDPARRALLERSLALFKRDVVPALPQLRRQVIHSDANDANVLVRVGTCAPSQIVSVIDFGDLHWGLVVAEAAIAATYALMGQEDPMAAATAVVRGYHDAHPLEEKEIAVLFPLILMRLAVSVVNSAVRKTVKPDDPYVIVSEAPAWRALELLSQTSSALAHATFRHACGLEPVRDATKIVSWIRDQAARMSSVLDVDLRTGPVEILDLSVSSLLLGANPAEVETTALTETLFGEMRRSKASVGVGRYDEARLLYVSPLFGARGATGVLGERRTIHLGVDLFVEPGARVRAPLGGIVHLVANNDQPQDYGPLVILRHETGDGQAFFTLYGHLSDDTLTGVKEGQRIHAGDEIGRVGSPPTNGNWAPHVHVQIVLDLLDLGRDFPGVCRAAERECWKALSPDPNLLLGIPAERFGKSAAISATLTKRKKLLGGSLSLSYDRPLKIVRGFGAYLYDETGRAFLDMYNNVPLVGHSHPCVVQAAQAQLGLLNTNTRYLHDTVLTYAERLTSLLPEPLRVCFFVNSGSEANELAVRMARTHTKRRDVIVLENAYHGHTAALIELSPYKFDGPGGEGRQSFVHVAPMPDDYRGPYKRSDAEAGLKYGREVGAIVERLRREGCPPAAFIAETLPSVGGQIVPPPGFLLEAYHHVRDAGGVCIADEVQVGFGRLGSHMWGFEMLGAVPDIVVMGKPMGNGFPLAAVVTTEEIAKSFDNGMEFFSTFGGNPVACAAGLAVLDVVRDEGLQARAWATGKRLRDGLQLLAQKHALIGDVRGAGLFIGLELVLDRKTLQPAATHAKYVVNRLRDLGVLTGTDGPHENVIKLRPPLILSNEEADLFLATLDTVLGESAMTAGR